MSAIRCFVGIPALIIAGACSARDAANPTIAEGRDYSVSGLVVAWPDAGIVSVAHEPIPGLMPAMTMPFTFEEPRQSQGLNPGDRVRFTLRVGSTTMRARSVQVVGQDTAALEAYRRSDSAASARVRPGDTLRRFALRDQNGAALTEASLRGRRTVLTFIFTRCPAPEYCPRMMGYFRQLQREIVADKGLADVHLLSVTLDPSFYTPQVLKAYGEAMNADFTRWRFATGTPDEVAALTRTFAVRTQASSAVLDHTLATALVDSTGAVVEIWRGNQWTVDEVLARLRQ